MPLLSPRTIALVGLAVGLAALPVGAAGKEKQPQQQASSQPTAAAFCPAVPLSQPFLPWGDTNSYLLTPGGAFEGGGQWTLGSGAAIVFDPVRAGQVGAGDGHVLQLASGSTATSGPMCADATMPSMRIFARRVSGAGRLLLTAVVSWHGQAATALGSIDASGTWGPSSPLLLDPTLLSALSAIGPLNVSLQLTAERGSVFLVDDVYVDPFRRI